MIQDMTRLDYYDILPEGMEAYLSHYGYHFSKKMCDWAVSNMRDRNGASIPKKTKEQVDNILATYGVRLENNKAYDAVYVYHMGVADYLGSSIIDEAHLARYVKDTIDDPDGYDGIAFTRFIADCNGSGTPVIWEDVI